jgi:hypothetical protein
MLLVLPALLCSNPASAQTLSGSIIGIVRDSSQAVVVGARVVATNVDTNFSKEARSSDPNGEYRLLVLPPGRYSIAVTAAGFQQFTLTDIVLKVNDQLRLDAMLTVGNMQQLVSVEANAVQVQTESTQLGDVIEAQKMLSLPLNGRSYLDLLGLQAGVVPIASSAISTVGPTSGLFDKPGNVSVSGQRENSNAFLVNGGDVNESRNMGAGLVPNLDSVAEFRLITNTFDAEYGKFSGGVMNAITKSGTNSLHGSVFEFLRNDKMDARGFFDPFKAELRRNQYGYAVGGPLWKNKIFWFTDFQGTRQVLGASTGVKQLPTADQRQGRFSPASMGLTVAGDGWARTLSQRLGYTVTNGERYSSATCVSTADCVFPGGLIPQKAWDPITTKLDAYIPLGNSDPIKGLFSDVSQKVSTRDDKTGQRIDLYHGKTGTWSFYYHFNDSTFNNPLNASFPGFNTLTNTRAQMFTVSDTKTLGPTAVNELRLSAFRTSLNNGIPTNGFVTLESLGFVTAPGSLGIIQSGPPGRKEVLPKINLNNFNFGPTSASLFMPLTTYMISDGFSKVWGSHSVKIGGEYRYLQLNARNVYAPTGNFTFNGTETGNDYADFLLGAPTNFVQASLQILDTRSEYGALFFQDAWKVKSNLTLNMGLRWEMSTSWYDTQGRLGTYAPGLQSTTFKLAPVGFAVPGDPGVARGIYPTQKDRFAPRLGLAWAPAVTDGFLGKLFGGAGKTSIRAAFGLYYLSQADQPNFGLIGDAPYGLYYSSAVAPPMAEPFRARSDGSSVGQRFPYVMPIPGSPELATLDWTKYFPLVGPGYKLDNVLPYAEHYNLSIQRELSHSMVLTLAYVGTQGHHLMTEIAANPADPALCLKLNTLGAKPACGPNGENQYFTLPDGTRVAGTRPSYLPHPYFSGVQLYTTIGNSNYNSLQVTVQRKAADLTFLAAYTYSKSIDGGTAENEYLNPYNYRLSRALSAFDMKHNFVGSYSWAIPFDRAFGRVSRRLTQGWSLSGITRLTTGLPVTINQASGDRSLIGKTGVDEPDVIAPVTFSDPHNLDASSRNMYFSKTSFANPPLGTIGTSNRRFFYGPGLVNTDFGVAKNTRITESMSFNVRVEYFNLFNHTQFQNPIGNYASSQFGSVTSNRAPRIGQISAKFVW